MLSTLIRQCVKNGTVVSIYVCDPDGAKHTFSHVVIDDIDEIFVSFVHNDAPTLQPIENIFRIIKQSAQTEQIIGLNVEPGMLFAA